MGKVFNATLLRIRPCSASLNRRVYPFFQSQLSHTLQLAYDYYPTQQSAPESAPIVFIHGLFGSKKNNRSISKVLARDLGRPVYAIDLRNHGDSPHNRRHDYLALAEDVESFLCDHKLSDATIIGHSMGAKTAMTIALKSPHLLANVVSVDNAPVDAALKSDFSSYINGMRKIEDAKLSKTSEADLILQDYAEDLPIRQFLLTNLIRDSSGTLKFRIPISYLASSLDHMADFPYKNPERVRFVKPSLFIRGTRSHYVPDETLPIIGQFFPRFELQDIESGHWVISENPQAFRKAVVDFLLRVQSSGYNS